MERLKVGVVGPCGAGKSTLITGLKQHGYWGKHIAQEHSYVADMWQRLTRPDVLVYLDVSYPLTLLRRKLNWTEAEYLIQIKRLTHARTHADMVIQTDNLSPQEILTMVIKFLGEISPPDHDP